MNIFTGVYRLITSPSGFFSLLCLAVLSVLSWHLGVAWATAAATAWGAFFAIIPAALGYFEHKETLAQMQQPQSSSSPPAAATPAPTSPVPTATTTTTTTVVASPNLPARGQI